jgi:hypothetical protein
VKYISYRFVALRFAKKRKVEMSVRREFVKVFEKCRRKVRRKEEEEEEEEEEGRMVLHLLGLMMMKTLARKP